MTDAEFDPALIALPRERTQLLPALLLAQRILGSVPDWAVERIASHLGLTVNDIEGVVTSYPELRRRPAGKHVIRVCAGLSCWTGGSSRLLETFEAVLGIRPGDTTTDGRFTLEEVSCCFICAMAPVVEMDGICWGRVAESTARALVSMPT